MSDTKSSIIIVLTRIMPINMMLITPENRNEILGYLYRLYY